VLTLVTYIDESVQEWCNVRSDFAWVHGEQDRVVVLSLEFGSHVADGHVECGFGGSVCGKSVFTLEEIG
jgi:hypothetical protein